MRYSFIISALILHMFLYCVLNIIYLTDVSDKVASSITIVKANYAIVYSTSTEQRRKFDAEYSLLRLFPQSSYDVDIVNWTLSCTMSPAYLADLAYTLKQITDVLEEFEITYMLEGGLVLGALRMNGPMPYDDDIDIAVFEEDFKPNKHLVYDAMRKRNFRVVKHDVKNKRWVMDHFFHIPDIVNGIKRPYIDLYMLRESRNKKYRKYVAPFFKRLALCPFKKTTIFGQEQQTPSLSTPIPTTTVSAPRGPQVVTNRALEAAWYHYKAQQRRTRAVLRPGLQKILHHRYGMLSTAMFLGRLYPVAADPFAFADCQYRDWYEKYYLKRPHPPSTENELCRTVTLPMSMTSQYNASTRHKRGAAISAYIMLERLKKTMCYQAKQSADIMLQGTLVNKYNNSIVTIEEEYNATDTMLFRQMCSMEETLCNVTFTCDDRDRFSNTMH